MEAQKPNSTQPAKPAKAPAKAKTTTNAPGIKNAFLVIIICFINGSISLHFLVRCR